MWHLLSTNGAFLVDSAILHPKEKVGQAPSVSAYPLSVHIYSLVWFGLYIGSQPLN